MKTKTRNIQNGFTLIELLVVISVIGLVAIVIFIPLQSSRLKAQDDRVIEDVQAIAKAAELYFADNQKYPELTTDNHYPDWSEASNGNIPSFTQWDELQNLLKPYIKSLRRVSGWADIVYTTGGNLHACIDGDTQTVDLHKGGYGLVGRLQLTNQAAINDGGIMIDYYERYGGTYELVPLNTCP